MSERFEIQARLLRRRDGVVVRDESRLACAEVLDDALRAANAWVAEGFTVWIYRVATGDGVRPVYRAVRILSPAADVPGATHRRATGRGGSRTSGRAA